MLPRSLEAVRAGAGVLVLVLSVLFSAVSCRRGEADATPPTTSEHAPAVPENAASAMVETDISLPTDIPGEDLATGDVATAAKLAAEAEAAAAAEQQQPTIAELTAAGNATPLMSFNGVDGISGSGGGGGDGGGGGSDSGMGSPAGQGLGNRSRNSPYGSGGNSSVGGITDPDLIGATLNIGQVVAAPAPVVIFERVELVVPITNSSATKPYDPDPQADGLDLSATFSSSATDERFIVPGFWDGTRWRIRFAAPVAGTWNYSVIARDEGGTDTATGSFQAVGATSTFGWLRLESSQLRDAAHGTGFPGWFRGVGYNIGWQYDVEPVSFANLRADGMNLLSFWLQVPWNPNPTRSALEPTIGNFDQQVFAYLDGVVQRAEQESVRLIPSIWSHDHLRDALGPWADGQWAQNAYRSIDPSPTEFFTLKDGAGNDTPQWKAQKKLYRYLIARFGYSPAIAGWVALVEANGTNAWLEKTSASGPLVANSGGQQKVKRWADAVRDWFAVSDPFRRSAEGYPLTVSLTRNGDEPVGEFDSDFTGHDPEDLLDLLSADSYTGSRNNVAVAGILGDYHDDWSEAPFAGRLGFITEFGGQVGPQSSADSPPYATQPGHLHHGLWGAIGAGATIAPLLWSDNGQFPLLDAPMRAELARVSDFNTLVDAALFGGKTLDVSAVSDAGVLGFRSANTVRAIAWVRSSTGASFTGAEVITFPAMTAGTYDVTWFDTDRTSTVTVVVSEVLAADGTLSVTVPGFATTRTDLAVMLVKQGLAPTSIVRSDSRPVVGEPIFARR